MWKRKLPKKRYAISSVVESILRTFPELAEGATLGGLAQTKNGCGKRVVVRITRCSLGYLDTDNLYASAKPMLDCLRESGFIADDSPKDIHLEVRQIQVARRKEVGTYVEIIYR